MAAAFALDELWHPASATALERALHPAGHGPNSSSLLRPQAAVVAVAYLAENYFLFVKLENLRIFQLYFFTGRGRSGKRHIACAGSLREHRASGGEPSQSSLCDASLSPSGTSCHLPRPGESVKGRAKAVEGALLASFSKGYQGHNGSASCLSLWERWMRPTGADGEGAPAPLRGAAAAAAEGPSNRRSAKNAFSEAASIFPLRLLLWG